MPSKRSRRAWVDAIRIDSLQNWEEGKKKRGKSSEGGLRGVVKEPLLRSKIARSPEISDVNFSLTV